MKLLSAVWIIYRSASFFPFLVEFILGAFASKEKHDEQAKWIDSSTLNINDLKIIHREGFNYTRNSTSHKYRNSNTFYRCSFLFFNILSLDSKVCHHFFFLVYMKRWNIQVTFIFPKIAERAEEKITQRENCCWIIYIHLENLVNDRYSIMRECLKKSNLGCCDVRWW